MRLRCRFGKHQVVEGGMRNGKHEFGRCKGCGIDMMRSDADWQRVPKGFRIVWRPRSGTNAGTEVAGHAAFAQEVDLRGVTVLGERTHGGQRFALVVLNQKDQRSYRSLADEVGTRGNVAEQVESRTAAPDLALSRLLRKERPPAPSVKLSDLLLSGRAEART
ncbi:MAG TPA: hypothetical protein VK391_08640 [Allosphingosinicella sp.]|nr:hypothetical protein [Allosphingosinicella sp.]